MIDPKKIGKYDVAERIGAGGCGVVYRARDPHIQREVAIKLCISKDDQQHRRFLREAQLIGSLNHPAIISIFDFGVQNSTPFLVEELLSGEDLGMVIRTKKPIGLNLKLDYLVQVAEALLFAHRAGVLHRDIKPSNVQVLESGQVKLMDFGVALLLEDEESRLTKKGALVGTIGYMAPEQINGLKLDCRADVFSFGALAYELVTGERPFPGNDLTQMIRSVLRDEPTPLTERSPECPPALEHLVDKCLEKDRERRYQGFDEVLFQFSAIRGETVENLVIEPQTLDLAGKEPVPSEPSPAQTVFVDPDTTTAAAAAAELPLAPAAGGSTAPMADFELRSGLAAPREGARTKSRLALSAAIALGISASLALWLNWDRLIGGADTQQQDSAAPGLAELAPAEHFRATLEVAWTAGGASVWMNGEELAATTPAQVTVAGAPGEAVRLELRRESKILAAQDFTLGPEFPTRWEPAPAAALRPFRITSKPQGAQIILDGQATGQVTPAPIELDVEARHELRLELDGYRPSGLSFALTDLTEEQRQRSELYFPLEPAVPPGFLVVEAPYPLRLEVAGRRFDATGRREIALPPGSYALRLSAPQVFLSERRKISVSSDQRTQISLPPAVEVRVMANPSRCRLRIDGREVDWLPANVRLVVGVHEFEFLWENLGRSQKLTREIRPDSQRLFASAEDPG